MFGLFKKDKLKELNELYNKKLVESMNAQRNGDMDSYAKLATEAQEYLDKIEEEERSQKKKID